MGQLADIVTVNLDDHPGIYDSNAFDSVGLTGQECDKSLKKVVRLSTNHAPGVMDQLNFGPDVAISINAKMYLKKKVVIEVEEEWFVLRLRLSGKQRESQGESSYYSEGVNGSLLYCKPGVEHRIYCDPQALVEGVSIFFRPAAIESRVGVNLKALLDNLPKGQDPCVNDISIELSSQMQVLVRELIDTPRMGKFYHLWAEVQSWQLICDALTYLEMRTEKQSCGSVRIRPWDVKRLEHVRNKLDRCFTNPPSIEELCRLSGMNRRKLTECFKILFSCTIREYIISQRMLHAGSLLRQSLPINIVAERVGYNDPSSFTKIFKRQYGVLPKDFSVTA
jgi:AraC family transcriptional regulator, transcriptional activator of the genes for pyochelin and ferripyochelin receptors